MTSGLAAPAHLPPPGIVGLDPAWSRLVTTPDHRGVDCTWHLLDNGADEAPLTLLCVHGNPSWSFLWRNLVAAAPPGVRVIAVDQLDMGFSDRTGCRRRLADRVADLVALTDALGLDGPVVTVAHDWGGPISLGWALHTHRRTPGSLHGMVLTNTAVHQPAGSPAPSLIRAARTRGLLRTVTVNTTTFLRGAVELSRPRLTADVRAGFLAPYATPARREAIADFVADIPLDDSHPSSEALEAIAAGLDELNETPALLLWGPSDPVFSDLYLHDLETRLPHAHVHRFVGASHFVSEQADVVGAVLAWINRPALAASGQPASTGRVPLWDELDRRRDSEAIAVAELGGDDVRVIDFADLRARVMAFGTGMIDSGIRRGDRVALMIPPGIDLTVALYACWRIGAVAVLVDSGLGPTNMRRALTSANPRHLVGVTRALSAARVLRWPGRRIAVDEGGSWSRSALRVESTMTELEARAAGRPEPDAPDATDDAVIVFTSGSTGPSKGVVYRHDQLQAQRDQLRDLYSIGSDDRLVAAFAPFALFGPALGITSAVPDMHIAHPGTLTAAALGDAVADIDATLVFTSPAALANVVSTADELHGAELGGVRLVMSAGAPVNPALLGRTLELFPNADVHTPYGMTEVLPVADISLRELGPATGGAGVCVGRPCRDVTVAVCELDHLGVASGVPSAAVGVQGEVVIRADHVKDRYDRLWLTEHRSTQPEGWHRSGDVGLLDHEGRLWIGGRLEHLIITDRGPVAPVPVELAAEATTPVRRAAAVAIGPVGTQVIAVVVETEGAPRRGRLARTELTDAVRAEVERELDLPVAAVLEVRALPVDRRHNSKIDRSRVARWASDVLAGKRWARQ